MNKEVCLREADYLETIPLDHWDMGILGEKGLEQLECHSVGCMAGHIAAKNYGEYREFLRENECEFDGETLYDGAGQFSSRKLGLNYEQEDILFFHGFAMTPNQKADQLRALVKIDSLNIDEQSWGELLALCEDGYMHAIVCPDGEVVDEWDLVPVKDGNKAIEIQLN